MSGNATSTAPKATRREWIGLAVLTIPCMLYSMDLTVLNLAVPHLTAELKPSASQLLWIVDIYGFLLAGSLITMGTLGDRIGRRRLLLIGAAAFGAASAVAAFSTSATMLIASRALLGVTAATLAPSTLSLLRNMFLDPRERTFAIGVWTAGFSAGGAIGPLIGGVLLTHFWWGSVFLLNIPIMLLLLALGPFLLPEFRDPNAGRLDILSAVLSLTAVLGVIYGIKRLAEQGAGWEATGAILLGLIIGWLFVRRQRTLADPLIDISLFRSSAFSASLAINILGLFVAFGTFLLLAQYLQLVLGMEPLEAGLWTAPSGVALAAGSMLAPQLVRWVSPGTAIAFSFVLAALGFSMLSLIGGSYGLGFLAVGFIIFCLGIAPVGALTTDLIIGAAPPERAGAASAISEASFEFGGALGIAVLGSVVTSVYRGAMTNFTAAGVPAVSIEAARDTLGGAVAAAHNLSGEPQAALLGVAREAFTQSLAVTSMLCAVLSLAAAVLAMLLLRNVRTASHG